VPDIVRLPPTVISPVTLADPLMVVIVITLAVSELTTKLAVLEIKAAVTAPLAIDDDNTLSNGMVLFIVVLVQQHLPVIG